MNTTKKEHYVPQCYLRNFQIQGLPDKINVFDKQKEQVRTNQNILDNASERYFYDINIDKILEESSDKTREEILNKLGDKYDILKNDNIQHLERFFSEVIEDDYSELLQNIIKNTSNASPWYKKNCYSLSIEEKSRMSIFLAFQFVRTKKNREILKDGMTKLYKALIPKLYNIEYGDVDGKINSTNIDVSIGKEAMKAEHASFITDPKVITDFANCFFKHIWIIYINKTKIPFWTSDAPISLNPMPNGFRSGRGLSSKGIEILFPLNNTITLGMYDREFFKNKLSFLQGPRDTLDRLYWETTDENLIRQFNIIQLRESYRCVFSSDTNFEEAQKLCKQYPAIKKNNDYFSVG